MGTVVYNCTIDELLGKQKHFVKGTNNSLSVYTVGISMVFGRGWSTGLCGCGDDLGICLLTWCLPCVTFGRMANILDEGQTSCCGMGCAYALLSMVQFQWLISCIYREKLRKKYSLPNEPCVDCCVHFCCEPCALCQEYAELKSRGWEPAKGYEAHKMVPPMPASMKKCLPF